MFLKHEFKVGFFRWVGPIFLGLLWDIKIFFWDPKILAAELQGVEEEKLFSFFWPLNSMIFLIFYDLKKKAKDLFLIWLIKCPYFFVVIADDKFEMIVGRTFLIFFWSTFSQVFFYESFLLGLSAKKQLNLLTTLLTNCQK